MAPASPSTSEVDRALAASVRDPRPMQAGPALVEGQLAVAEPTGCAGGEGHPG